MMKGIEVFLDMDGVSADWTKAMVTPLGIDIKEFNNNPKYSEYQKEVYKKNPNFFKDLPIVAGFIDLIDYVATVENNGGKISILSSIGNTHHDKSVVRADKIAWVNKNIAPLVKIHNIHIVDYNEDKSKYASDGAILVDDHLANCQRFEANGGMFVHISENYGYNGERFGKHLLKVISDYKTNNSYVASSRVQPAYIYSMN